MFEPLQFTIKETIKKNRLDKFLAEQITTVSKIHLRTLIDNGECLVNGDAGLAGYQLKKDDLIEITVDVAAITSMMPEAIPLTIVFEDHSIIVVDKPAGMLVHPTLGQKNSTLLNALSYYLNKELLDSDQSVQENLPKFIRPGLIHRLDRQTSGLIVIAKTSESLSFLSNHFQRRLVKKNYTAIVAGEVAADSGIISEPIGHFEIERVWGIKADGKSAETKFQVAERFAGRTRLELEPVTGRTNQLRIHCAHIGHPIIGDDRYGGDNFSRLCLHAARLGFYHPATNIWMEFESAVPPEFKEIE